MCARKFEDDDFGARLPPVIEFLKNLLQRYTEGGQILKELIQNADDAKAKRVKFCIDARQHSIDPGGLWKPSLSPFQGPALLAWNDSVFTDEDWRNIGKMHQSMKEEDVLKVGRFGLGFQSVYNITDLPTIVSGDFVGIMDPHETVIKNEGKTGKRFPLEEFNRYAAQSAPFEGVFGFYNHTNHYDGTLFRFPFRNNKFISKISDRMFTADEAHRVLYESLAEEAPRLLLFLNHVTTVELYRQVHSSKSFQPELLLRIAIEGGNVSTTRQWCIEKSMASHTPKGLQTPVCSISEYAISVEGPLSRGAARYSYLVCNTVGSSNAEMVGLAKKLKVIPRIGLASPLPGPISPPQQVFKGLISEKPDCSHIENIVLKTFHKNRKILSIEASPATLDSKGFAFCFLPMSSNNDTGLPVHIHGYFSLSDNRRRVRWPDLDDQSDEAKWNKCLVQHLISPSYAVLITTSCSLMTFQFPSFSYQQLCKSSRPFALLPLMSATREKAWEYLVKKVLPLLSNLPVLWTPAGGGKWVKPCEAFCPPLNGTIPNSILDLLIQLGLPVVCFPRHIQQDCQLPFAEVTPQVVRKWFRSNEMLKSKVNSDISLLKDCLRFVTSDRTDELTNIPLLLLKSGQVVPFGQQKVYLVNESLSKVLHNLDKLILSNVLYTDLGKLFNQLARSKINKLIVANAQIVCNSLLPESIETWTHTHVNPVQWTPNRSNHPSAEWLLNVWTYITNNEVIDSVATLPLVVSEGPENVTNEETYSLYRLDTGNLFFSGSNQDLNIMAQLLGCVLIKHSRCYFRLGPKLSQYLPKLSPEGLLHVLPNLPQVAQRVSQLLNDEQKRQLRSYLSSASQSLSSLNELNCIRSLSIFEHGVGMGGSRFTNLMSPDSPHVYILPLPTIQFPTNIPFPDNILKVCHEDINLYQRAVGVVPSSLGQFAQNLYTFATKQHFTMRNTLLLWLIEYSHPEYPNSKLEQFISKTAIIPTANGPLQYICKLYDPKDSKLKDFFLPFDSSFPPEEYYKVLSKLRLYNLKTWESVSRSYTTFLDFIEERAKSVQLALTKVSKEEAVKRSQLILAEIFKNRNCAHLLQSLKSIPFLFCNQSPPPRYPKQLLWVGSEVNRLCSPAELCLDLSHSHLVGSVLLFLSSDYPLPLGVTSQEFAVVTPNTVEKHFANITSLPSNVLKDKEVYVMVKSIYEYFAGQSSSFLNAELCIWIDSEYKFVRKAKCALEPLGNCSLAPYRYSLQDASCLRDHKAMWLESGVSKCLTVEDGVEVVHEIHSSLGRHGTLSPEQLDIVVSVANQVVKYKKGPSIPNFVLPSTANYLKSPSELIYDDQYLEKGLIKEDEKSLYFLHKSVTAEVARYFSIQPLSIKVAPSEALEVEYESTGPHESITHRIKCLVEDYGDNIDVFKELIQNADDAGATVVKFLISWKHFGQSHLVTKEMAAWQGPALYAYNDKTFNESDLRNICKIAGQTKLTDHTKIGRFGVGFCATYHLTDVPSFVTNNWLQIFDPNLKYLGERVQPTKPGMLIDFVKRNTGLKEYYSDQIAPYEGVFGCSIVSPPPNGFDGTLFRFPFRKSGIVSEISDDLFSQGSKRVDTLKGSLSETAANLLLFLQNVNRIELYETTDQNSEANKLLLIERTDPGSTYFKKRFTLPKDISNSMTPSSQIMELLDNKSQSSLWMVSSALGINESLQHASNQSESGLVPFAEVAVKLKTVGEDNQYIPLRTKGGISCFLPLPFTTTLHFHINGYFEVTQDRKLLKMTDWNKFLIQDAVVCALLELLQGLTRYAPHDSHMMEEFLQSYYSIFPHHCHEGAVPDTVQPVLAESFKSSLKTTNSKIIWLRTNEVGGCWISPQEVQVLSSDFHIKPFDEEMCKKILDVLVSLNEPVVDVPPTLFTYFERYSFKEFCNRFLSNIKTVSSEIRDEVLLFILRHFEGLCEQHSWLKDKLRETEFVPTNYDYQLCLPVDLINPKVHALAVLYDGDEDGERKFPSDRFAGDEKVLKILEELGMAHAKLRNTDVIDRAKSVINLDPEKAEKRSQHFQSYLVECHFHDALKPYNDGSLSYEDKELVKQLSVVQFLQVKKKPLQHLTCWKETDNIFEASSNLNLSCKEAVVFTKKLIVHDSFNERLSACLQFQSEPEVADVVEHLATIVQWWNSFKEIRDDKIEMEERKSLLNFVTKVTDRIYFSFSSSIKSANQPNEYNKAESAEVLRVLETLKALPFVWVSEHFYKFDQVFFNEDLTCSPFLMKAPDDHRVLLTKLGVRDRAEPIHIVQTLCKIKNTYFESINQKVLEFVISCARRISLADNVESFDLYLPDKDSVLRHTSELMYMDNNVSSWLRSLGQITSEDIRYCLHPDISLSIAQRLGIDNPVEALSSKYENLDFLEGSDYGQHEDLCDRISGILKNYHADASLFQEFIQNADDAGASEVSFILDCRRFPDEKLFTQKENWKDLQSVPSLLIFNNRRFTKNDIDGITKLGCGGKKDSPESIGRFGIGFNVSYHITDCPMFVSHSEEGIPEDFCTFDPTLQFAPKSSKVSPGRHWKLRKLDCSLGDVLKDQMKPFSDETLKKLHQTNPDSFKDCDQNWPNGFVVFRLPLTRDSLKHFAYKHIASGEVMTVLKLRGLLKGFVERIEDTLLFLKEVKHISCFEIDANEQCTLLGSTTATLNKDDLKLSQEFNNKMYKVISAAKKGETDDPICSLSPQVIYRVSLHSLIRKEIELHTQSEITAKQLSEYRNIESDNTWLVSKRYGNGDVDPKLLTLGFQHSFLPLGGVAAKLVDGICETKTFATVSESDHSLFCYLPLPLKSDLPVHVNGHFWLSDSRRDLQHSTSHILKDWNALLLQNVVLKAYYELLVHCKQFSTWNPKHFTGWYYSLFPNVPSHGKLEEFQLPEKLYVMLFEEKAEILLSMQSNNAWLSLSNDRSTMGLFYRKHVYDDLEAETLLMLDLPLTCAPYKVAQYLKDSLKLSESNKISYDGIIIPQTVRNYLRQMSADFEHYRETILKSIIPLLKYCLSDIGDGCNWKQNLQQLPLMKTSDGELKLMCEIFASAHSDLLPHCKGHFVHEDIERACCVNLNLANLGIIRSLSNHPEFVAEHLLLPQDRSIRPLPVDEETIQKLVTFWSFLSDVHPEHYCKLESFSVVPTSTDQLYPLCLSKVVLYSSNADLPLLDSFNVPVVDFKKLINISTSKNIFSGLFAHSHNADELLKVLCHHKHSLDKIENIKPKDVHSLVSLLAKATQLQQGCHPWLKEIPLFLLTDGTLTQVNTFPKVIAIEANSIPYKGLKELWHQKNFAIIEIPPFCESFIKCAQIPIYTKDVPNLLNLYNFHLLQYFTVCSADDILSHVEFLQKLYITSSDPDASIWKEIFSQLSNLSFITTPQGAVMAKQLYDPNNRLFKAFLSEDHFPPANLNNSKWIKFLKNVGLIHKVTDDSWLKFANQLANETYLSNKVYLRKCNLLLYHLTDWVELMKLKALNSAEVLFLRKASSINFIPSQNWKFQHEQVSLIKKLFPNNCQLPHTGLITLRNSVIHPTQGSCLLACFTKPMLPETFRISKSINPELLEALGVSTVNSKIVATNLIKLSEIFHNNIILPSHGKFFHSQTIKSMFLEHYEYLNGYTCEDQPVLCNMLQNCNCLLLDNKDSIGNFQLLPGRHVVEFLQRGEEYLIPFIQLVPEYCKHLIKFLELLGVSRELTISHCALVLKTLHSHLQPNAVNPNSKSAAIVAYDKFIAFARNVTPNHKQPAPVLVPPLLSQDYTLESADNLVLNDTPWFADRLGDALKHLKFLLPPPNDENGNLTVPDWLNIKLLSNEYRETPHAQMLNEANICTEERLKELDDSEGCKFVTHLETILKSDEFFNGLLRLIKHDTQKPPSEEVVELLSQRLSSLRIACVQMIKTVLCSKNGTEVPNSTNEDIFCLVTTGEPPNCSIHAYITPHKDAVNYDKLLHDLITGLNKQFNGVIRDSYFLKEMISVSESSMITELLTELRIPMYVHSTDSQSRSDIGMNVRFITFLNHIIICNFRVNEIVKYKTKEGEVINAKIVNIETDDSGNPTSCLLVVKPKCKKDEEIKENVKCHPLLLSKYISSLYLKNEILKVWKLTETDSLTPELSALDKASAEPITLLSFNIENVEELRAQLIDTFNQVKVDYSQPQFSHMIERILYHLQYLCLKSTSANFAQISEVVLSLISDEYEMVLAELERLKEIRKQLIQQYISITTPATHSQSYSSFNGSNYGQSDSHMATGGRRDTYTPTRVSRSGLWMGGGSSSYRHTLWQDKVEEEPEPQPNTIEAKMWLIQALNDCEAASSLLDASARLLNENPSVSIIKVFPAQVCFLAHECTEKCLKALFLALFGLDQKLVFHTNVKDLCQELQKQKLWNSNVDLMPQVLQISRHFMQCRHPDYTIPKEAPAGYYRRHFSEAKEVMAAVHKVFKTIEDNFPSVKKLMDEVEAVLPNCREEAECPTDLPKDWLSNCMKERKFVLVPLRTSCSEYISISERFYSSMGKMQAQIFCIERIQNLVLWKDYASRKSLLVERLGYCNEMTAFHGTSVSVAEAIYKGQRSFDVLESRAGLYGRGAYFARDANVSHGYVGRGSDGLCKMLVAKVLLGDAKDCTQNRNDLSLLKKKKNEAKQVDVDEHYDSILGDLGTSDVLKPVYIVQRNDQSYPAYCITYTS